MFVVVVGYGFEGYCLVVVDGVFEVGFEGVGVEDFVMVLVY